MLSKKRLLGIAICIIQFQFVISQVEVVEEERGAYLPSNYYKYNKFRKRISDYKKSNIYNFTNNSSNTELKKVRLDLKTNKIIDSSSFIFNVKGIVKDYNESFISYNYTNDISALSVNEYLNYIIYKKKKKRGVILKNKIIPAIYDSIGKPFLVKGMDPMILVGVLKNKKMKWGIINSNGKSVFPLEYDEIIIPNIKYDLKKIKKASQTNVSSFITKEIIGQYDGFYQNHKIIVKKNEKYGLINANGNKVLNCEYDKITANNQIDFYILEKNKKFGFLWIRSKYRKPVTNEPGITSNTGIIRSSMVSEDLILKPNFDFKILKEHKWGNRSFYSLIINNKKINVVESEILKLLED